MGQRLDRPSAGGTTNNPQTSGSNTVATSLSTTFSSSSASSTSSTSSNTSAATTTNAANLTNMPRTANSNSSGQRHHRHRHHRSRGQSVPETNQVASITTTTNGEMSPRTRFRTEMARRGYTNTSSDLFFRLFQFPPQSQPQTVSASASATANIEPILATPSTNSTTSSGTGLSAFRFFNLGGGNSSSANTGDLDSDLSSDEDEPHWNHNMSSLAHSLPLFFGIRDFKCFVCSKQIPADDVEAHIMMCLTKPRLTYIGNLLRYLLN